MQKGRKMINFHIGAPRIGAELLQAMTAASTLTTLPDKLIFPQASYRNSIRTLVNTRRSADSMEDNWEDAQTLIASLTHYDTVAISQHALLGTPQEIISSPRILPRAAGRIATLSSLFEGHPLTFHLAITNQVDYISTALGAGARAAIASGMTLSWFDLISQLKAAAPERPIIVWDFERPRDVALAFVVAMLDAPEDAFIEDARKLIKQHQTFEDRDSRLQNLNGLEGLLARLDDQYEVDLQAIAEAEGVSLILSGAISEKLRV